MPSPSKTIGNNGSITITVQLSGWDQLVNATQQVQTQFINQSFDPGLSRMNTVLTQKMKEKMHYWTGRKKAGTPHMRDVTRAVKLGALQYATQVPVRYALAENRRPGAKAGYGPHKFAEPSINETVQSIPIFAREWQQWIATKFNQVKG